MLTVSDIMFKKTVTFCFQQISYYFKIMLVATSLQSSMTRTGRPSTSTIQSLSMPPWGPSLRLRSSSSGRLSLSPSPWMWRH